MRASAPQRFFVPPIDRSGPATAASQTLTPNLFDESVDTFFTPQVNQKIFPGLYSDPDVFFTPKVNEGLRPSLYVDPDTFFTPKINRRLTDALYSDPDTFYTPVVTQPGAATQTLLPSLYGDSDTFYTAVVSARKTLTPALFSELPDTFLTPILSEGTNDIFPDQFSSLTAFFFTSGMEGGEGSEEESGGFAGRQNRRVKVNSSNVDYVSYAKNHKELVVRFKTGEVYKYDKVPPGRVKALLSAKSTGGYLHNKIVPRYAGKRT